jgi:hypothetical protein
LEAKRKKISLLQHDLLQQHSVRPITFVIQREQNVEQQKAGLPSYIQPAVKLSRKLFVT